MPLHTASAFIICRIASMLVTAPRVLLRHLPADNELQTSKQSNHLAVSAAHNAGAGADDATISDALSVGLHASQSSQHSLAQSAQTSGCDAGGSCTTVCHNMPWMSWYCFSCWTCSESSGAACNAFTRLRLHPRWAFIWGWAAHKEKQLSLCAQNSQHLCCIITNICVDNTSKRCSAGCLQCLTACEALVTAW